MRLYLSSYRIPNVEALKNLTDKELHDLRVAIIPNAKDYYSNRAKSIKITELISDLKDVGMQSFEVVDLQDFRNADLLADTLSKYDLLWVAGGNTFCLMYEIRKSGFDIALPKLLRSGLIYAGESAGAVVAGTTLKGVEFADVPEFAEEVYWEGLNLISSSVIPHADSREFAEAITLAREKYGISDNQIELKNDEALVVNETGQTITSKETNATL